MKKRAKQLAMLGLTVTMMCGTQMTAFASGLGEEAPVAIETEAKATANEEIEEEVKVEAKEEKADAKEEVKTEVKEEVVTGTEVAETPVVEETEVKETVAGTEELVGLGVSVEAEAETEAPAVPQTDVEADAPVVIPETEETNNKVADVKGELTGVKFDREVNGVITLTDKDFEESGLAEIWYVLYGTKTSGGTDVPIYFNITTKGDFGLFSPQDIDDVGEYKGTVGVYKSDLEEAGGTKTYTGTFIMEDTEAGGIDDTLDFSITVKYEKGNEGGGTVTPEPEKPQPEPEKPQPEPEKPNPDGGNGGTETPDPEKDGWIKTDEGWKYYENGQKVTGWKAVSEKWYYFNENGIMETGWASVSGHWYYLNADGSMATGWVSVGGHWYYLNTDGSMASSQWIDGWYVDASGKML